MLHHTVNFCAMINDYYGISADGFCNNVCKKEIAKFLINPANDYIWNNKLNKIFFGNWNYFYAKFKKYYKDMDGIFR